MDKGKSKAERINEEIDEYESWRKTTGQDYPEQIAHIKYAEKLSWGAPNSTNNERKPT